ncbi:hypothetical protein ABW19_dt0208914 [Dactylella cylindrospora]|nr:hypothetical protein ABW19_dt0208914 [Dactylella cylindrospora]
MGKQNRGARRRAGEKEKKLLAELLALGDSVASDQASSDATAAEYVKQLRSEIAELTSPSISTEGSNPQATQSVSNATATSSTATKDLPESHNPGHPIAECSPDPHVYNLFFQSLASSRGNPSSIPSSTTFTSDPTGLHPNSSNPRGPTIALMPPNLRPRPITLKQFEQFINSLPKGPEDVLSSPETAGRLFNLFVPEATKEQAKFFTERMVQEILRRDAASEMADSAVKSLKEQKKPNPDSKDTGQLAGLPKKVDKSDKGTFACLPLSELKARARVLRPIPLTEADGTVVEAFPFAPVYTHRAADPTNDEITLHPNGFEFQPLSDDFPGIKLPGSPVPQEKLDAFDREAVERDWKSSWPFLVHTILNEGYIMGRQLVIWVDEQKLCWATIDEPLDLLPRLDTLKLAWPQMHTEHEFESGEESDGICRSCLLELDARDLQDFAPALGFPSIKRPLGYRIKVQKKRKGLKQIKAGASKAAKKIPSESKKASTPLSSKAKAVSSAAGPKVPISGENHRPKESLTTEANFLGVKMYYELNTGTLTAKKAPATVEEKEIFYNAAKLLVADVESSGTQLIRQEQTNYETERCIIRHKIVRLEKNAYPFRIDESPAPPIASPLTPVPLSLDPSKSKKPSKETSTFSPKPKKHSGPEIYDKLRSQRFQLSLGIARFVIDALKDGKSPYFDVSLDGRIEMGHRGDTFPVKYAKDCGDSDTSEEQDPNLHDAIKQVTAPIIRIRDKKSPKYKGRIEFPPAVAWQEMFKPVEVQVGELDHKEKGERAEGKGDSSNTVSFGSQKYKIAAGPAEKIYPEIEQLADGLVIGMDACDEAWNWMMNRDRTSYIQSVLSENPAAIATITHAPKDTDSAKGKSSEAKDTSSKKNGEKTTEKDKNKPKEKGSDKAKGSEKATTQKVIDVLNPNQGELIQLLKELPSSSGQREPMGFEAHFKTIDNCLQKLKQSNEAAKGIIKQTLKDNPVPPARFPPTNVKEGASGGNGVSGAPSTTKDEKGSKNGKTGKGCGKGK